MVQLLLNMQNVLTRMSSHNTKKLLYAWKLSPHWILLLWMKTKEPQQFSVSLTLFGKNSVHYGQENVHCIIIWTKPFIIWWPIVLLGGIILVLIYTSLWATCSTISEERTMWFPRAPQEFTFIFDDIALVAKCNFAVHFLFSLCCRTLSMTLFLHEELPLLVELELLWLTCGSEKSLRIHVYWAGDLVLGNSSIMESTSQLLVQAIVQRQHANSMLVYCLLNSTQLLERFWYCSCENF